MHANAVALVEPGRFEPVVVELPPVGAEEALLRVLACGICGTDVEQRRGDSFRGPVILGHEPVGVIEEIGPDAAGRWGVGVGDLVAVESVVSCGDCRMCRSGRVPCEGGSRAYGFSPLDGANALVGGYAERMLLVRGTKVHRFATPVTPAVATMYNPLGAGIAWAVKAGELAPGDTVVIQGSGQRGLMCLVAARAAGAERVIVTDVESSAWKLELATRFGADAVVVADRDDPVAAVLELTHGRGADLVLDVSGTSPQPVLAALEMVRAGGVIVLGAIKAQREIPGFVSDKLVMKGATMRGVRSVDGDSLAQAVALIDGGTPPWADLHTHSLGLDEVDHAISLLAGETPGEHAFHVTIEPPFSQLS